MNQKNRQYSSSELRPKLEVVRDLIWAKYFSKQNYCLAIFLGFTDENIRVDYIGVKRILELVFNSRNTEFVSIEKLKSIIFEHKWNVRKIRKTLRGIITIKWQTFRNQSLLLSVLDYDNSRHSEEVLYKSHFYETNLSPQNS